MKNKKILFAVILFLTMAALVIVIVKPAKLGLDLVGGSRLVLEASTTNEIKEITPEIMSNLKYTIEKRINKLGVAETLLQQEGDKRLLIEIPNIYDPEKAKDFLGQTAELEFKRPVKGGTGEMAWQSTGLTGKDLKSASFTPDTNHGGYAVLLEFKPEGAKKFADLTTELLHQPMAIFFNGSLHTAPVIQSVITDGRASITGGDNGYSAVDAKDMADLLNAGALPVPAKIVEENTVGPTLGADSIHKSLFAGILGLSLVMLFMLTIYRLPGIVANIALLIYGLLVFSIFKTVPVTLTLAGIAGFILSMGMAVDANILIFERTKEELKAGRTLFTAINTGFDRAFASIFDSNMTTIIICLILYALGTSIVRGFALTLVIGVLVSMFTAITVTKNFMHLFFGTGQLKHPGWFGLKAEDIGQAYEAQETKREKAKFGVLD